MINSGAFGVLGGKIGCFLKSTFWICNGENNLKYLVDL